VANFGEVRVLDSVPGILIESAFHDGTAAAAGMRMPDNESLQDPRFRRLLGYAIYQGLAEYFDPGVSLLPRNPPLGLYLVHAPGQGLRVGWLAVESAVGYRVRYGETPGLSEGLVTEETAVELSDLVPGQPVFVQVSALNEGGEGPPSELAAARFRGDGQAAQLLLVSGFDRQDARIGEFRNRRHYAWPHAVALNELDRHFDFASNESIESGVVRLTDYRLAIWNLGEESTADETFSTMEQTQVTSFLDGGGALLATGAEIGWDLMERGTGEDLLFFIDAFGANYAADDADSFLAAGVGLFFGIGDLSFDDGTGGIYPVEYPDAFNPGPGEMVLEYPDGTAAGVAYDRSPGRTVLIGFPFESVVDPEDRFRLMQAALSFLAPEEPEDGGTSDAGEDAGEDAGGDPGGEPGEDAGNDDAGSDPGADPAQDAGPDPSPPDDCGCGREQQPAVLWWLFGLIGLVILRHTRRRP